LSHSANFFLKPSDTIGPESTWQFNIKILSTIINSLDFVINRFFMKLFKKNNLETVTHCRMQFNFDLPSNILKKISNVFARRYRFYRNVFCS